MKIAIIGGGSIGLLLASYLSTQHDVTIYVRRQEQKEAINTHGLYLGQECVQGKVKASFLSDSQTAACVFVCVKQTELHDVLPFVQKFTGTPTIFLQNGMGHIQMIENLKQPVFVGVIEHGARRITDNRVEHTGQGVIKLASYQNNVPLLKQWVTQLDQTNFPVEQAVDWYQLLAEKLIVNAVINPLTAIFRVPNRDVVMNAAIRRLAQTLCAETAAVLACDFKKQWEHVQAIAQRTGKNRSSMLTDIEAGRQTEIDAITGYILKVSKVEIPYTMFVYQSIKALETQKGIDT